MNDFKQQMIEELQDQILEMLKEEGIAIAEGVSHERKKVSINHPVSWQELKDQDYLRHLIRACVRELRSCLKDKGADDCTEPQARWVRTLDGPKLQVCMYRRVYDLKVTVDCEE